MSDFVKVGDLIFKGKTTSRTPNPARRSGAREPGTQMRGIVPSMAPMAARGESGDAWCHR